jgi:galactokinase
MSEIVAVAPGRVNLIGDHTDYTGGLVFPMAIDRWTTIRGDASDVLDLVSEDDPDDGAWVRYVRAVANLMESPRYVQGRVSTTIPIGAGLSSSAALEVASALALGFSGSVEDLAQLCRQAEHDATGVPCGIMDQLCIAGARDGHAMLLDCSDLSTRHVPLPPDVKVVVRFVAQRTLEGSEYATRVAECAAAEHEVGPLRSASLGDVEAIVDPVIRRRARHVVSENDRVRRFVSALEAGDLATAGEVMVESHHSLARDYEVSTAAMDAAVEELSLMPGVYGARMTGGGFGGCVVALCDPDVVVDGWLVSPAGPAVVHEGETDVD